MWLGVRTNDEAPLGVIGAILDFFKGIFILTVRLKYKFFFVNQFTWEKHLPLEWRARSDR
jgi:hypothetical protein